MSADDRYAFGPFVLEPTERRLLRDGEPVDLPSKAFDTLVVLVERAGHLVTKDQLLDAVWPDTVVEENYVSVNVSKLRAALGETAQDWTYIETVPRSGYRFAPVVEAESPEEVVLTRRTRQHLVIEEDVGPQRALRSASRMGRLAFVGVALAAVLAVAALAWQARAPGTPGAVRSVAVLPLRALGPLEPEGLGLSLADALITQLGAVDGLDVRSTSAVLSYAEDEWDPVAVGRALGVDAVLDGRAQQSGARLRVTLQLVGTRDGTALWSGAFTADAADLLAVQDALAAQVVQALALDLDADQTVALDRRRTDSPAAHEAYLRGRHLFNKRTGPDLRESLAAFREAADADPTFALPYAAMAEVYALLVWYAGVPPREAYPRARAAAERALALDGTLAEAYVPLATLMWVYEWDVEAAERLFRRALALNPSLTSAHHGLGQLLAYTGRLDEGLEHLEQARALDPLSPVLAVDTGTAFLFNGRIEEATQRYRAVLELEPDFALARVFLSIAYDMAGRPEDALAEIETAVQTVGRVPLWLTALGRSYAVAGREAEARAVLAELDGLGDERFVSPVGLALIHEGLGERGAALDALDRAVEARDPMLIYLAIDPRLDGLRDVPRFEVLQPRVDLGH